MAANKAFYEIVELLNKTERFVAKLGTILLSLLTDLTEQKLKIKTFPKNGHCMVAEKK